MIKGIGLNIVLILSCACFSACKNDKGTDNSSLLVDTLLIEQNTGEKAYFVLPSVELIFDLRDLEIPFKPRFVNPPHNYKNYQSIISKSLNLGIYVTDFTYLVSIENSFRLNEYLNVIQSLSNDLNIRDVFTEKTIRRYLGNMHNADSLYDIILETYDSFVKTLQSSNRDPMLLTVSIGSLVELLYLISSNINSNEDFIKLQSEMENYSFLLNEYSSNAQLYLSDPMVTKLMPDLENLYEILQLNKAGHQTVAVKKGKSKVTISKGGLDEIDYQSFMEVKEAVKSIRLKYVTWK